MIATITKPRRKSKTHLPKGYRVTKRHNMGRGRVDARLFGVWVIDHKRKEAGWVITDVCYGCDILNWVNSLTIDSHRRGDTHLEYVARELVFNGRVKEGGKTLHYDGVITGDRKQWLGDEAA